MNGSRGEGRAVLALELPPATTRAQSSFLLGVKSQHSQEAAFKDDATATCQGILHPLRWERGGPLRLYPAPPSSNFYPPTVSEQTL
jgi:hypothetical protein